MRTRKILAAGAAVAATTAAFAGSTAPAGARLATVASARPNIVQTAIAAGKFKTLVALVKQAGLAGTLEGKGPFTVFAPTDEAFAKVPKSTLTALAKNKSKLRAVLLYHVAAGRLTSAKVISSRSIMTLEGQPLPVHTSKGKVTVGDARVIATDVAASNGVIHVINAVLIPPR